VCPLSGAARLVEPYIHGTAGDGTEMLVAFQTSGASSSGATLGWKALRVGEIEAMEVHAETFIMDRPGYAGGRSKNIAIVHCYV